MPSWDMGYHSEILYTFGYYKEINPLWAEFIFANLGIAFPNIRNGGGYACELGFGQGVSINMHANSSTMTWYGTDFNPSQVNFAKHLANQGHAQMHLFDDAFGDFAKRTDLPQFDYICLHGIWSWISKENQQYIVDFIQNHLKIGGVVYVSYNVSPGFITFEPVRHLMKEFNDNLIAESCDNDARIQLIKQFLNSISSINPSVIKSNPNLPQRIAQTMTKDTHYLTGEYLHQYWDIIHFNDMAKNLERAKLNFAGSATGSEHLDEINLTTEQRSFLIKYKNTPLYESSRDFIVNQQFRRDFFVKGAMRLSEEQQKQALYDTVAILTVPPEDISYNINGRIGVAHLKEEVYKPVVTYFGDQQTHSFGETIAALENEKLNATQILEALRTLTLVGIMQPARREQEISEELYQNCKEFNRNILLNKIGSQITCLACPIIQGGLYVSPISMHLLAKYLSNPDVKAEQLTTDILKQLKNNNSVLSKDGKPITKDKEKRELITESVNNFLNKELPLFTKLRMI